MAAAAVYPNVYVIQSWSLNSCSLAICQKLQTNFKKLKIVERKKRNKRRSLFKTTQEISN